MRRERPREGITRDEHVQQVRRAIESAIAAAEEGDVVLVLGKGHETGQEVRGDVLPFDDRTVAREILAARSGSADFDPDSGSMTA